MTASPSPSPVRVSVALILNADRIVVGVRPAGTDLAGKHEFPGGKCLPEESFEECAKREALEETGLAVAVDHILERCFHSYPHADVDLWFCQCRLVDPAHSELRNGFQWIKLTQLTSLDFPEANASVIQKLIQMDKIAGKQERKL